MTSTITTVGEALVRTIREVADPEMIILFGSQARGDAGPDSDIDLLIVQDRSARQAPSRWQEAGRIQRALPRVGLPIDMLLFAPPEFEKWRTARNHVVARALREGRILYERPGGCGLAFETTAPA